MAASVSSASPTRLCAALMVLIALAPIVNVVRVCDFNVPTRCSTMEQRLSLKLKLKLPESPTSGRGELETVRRKNKVLLVGRLPSENFRMDAPNGIPFFHMFFLDSMNSSMDNSDNPPMDPEVWSAMPNDVLEAIFMKLPVPAQARFQVVSKGMRWFSSTHERFQRERAHRPIYGLICNTRNRSYFSHADDDSTDLQVPYEVHKLGLGFIPPECGVGEPWQFQRFHPVYRGKVVIFLHTPIINGMLRCIGQRICVVNPVNRTWRQLPDLVDADSESLGLLHVCLMFEGEERAFQVLVLHLKSKSEEEGACPAYASVYSSRSNEWTTAPLPRKDNDFLADALRHEPSWKEHIYGIWPWVGDDDTVVSGRVQANCGLFSDGRGKRVRGLAPPNYGPVGHNLLGLVQLADGTERLLAVPRASGSCRILGLPIASGRSDVAQKWEQVAALPRDLAMRLAPRANFDMIPLDDTLSDTEKADLARPYQFPSNGSVEAKVTYQVAGTCVVVTLEVEHKPHVVVYDYVLGTWKIVLSRFLSDDEVPQSESPDVLLPWEKALKGKPAAAIFLEPRPGLRLGIVDCPPDLKTCN